MHLLLTGDWAALVRLVVSPRAVCIVSFATVALLPHILAPRLITATLITATLITGTLITAALLTAVMAATSITPGIARALIARLLPEPHPYARWLLQCGASLARLD